MDARLQLAEVLSVCHAVLEGALIGAYLHGSAALGELRPDSDLDVLTVVDRPLTNSEKRALVHRLKDVSQHPTGKRRPVEVTVVVHADVHPWRHPARMDLQYGEWLRKEFEREDGPWSARLAPDLASLITMAVLAERPLFGPPASDMFEPVPAEDYLDAITSGIADLVADLTWDTRNVVLTLARIWSTVSTGLIRSKDEAAAWAGARLPAEHRSTIERARRAYLGRIRDYWDADLSSARLCCKYMQGKIDDVLAAPSTLPTSIDLTDT